MHMSLPELVAFALDYLLNDPVGYLILVELVSLSGDHTHQRTVHLGEQAVAHCSKVAVNQASNVPDLNSCGA